MIMLRGEPKAGKTTVVERTVELLGAEGVRVGGFVTREIRPPGGRRTGFAVRSLTGEEAVLADQDLDTGVRVGRFGVDVAAFERVALSALSAEALAGCQVVVIDEVARMELASAAFVARLLELVDSPVPLIATVHVYAHPVTDALLARPGVEMVDVTAANRDRLPGWLVDRVRP